MQPKIDRFQEPLSSTITVETGSADVALNRQGDAIGSAASRAQRSKPVLVAILGVTAAGIGITLTASSLCVFAELYWVAAVLAQAEARIHRGGQRKLCRAEYLIQPGSLDEYMFTVLNRKQRDSVEILDRGGAGRDAFNLATMATAEQ